MSLKLTKIMWGKKLNDVLDKFGVQVGDFLEVVEVKVTPRVYDCWTIEAELVKVEEISNGKTREDTPS